MNWPNFAAMNGQQAPTGWPAVSGRQSSRLAPAHTASINRNFDGRPDQRRRGRRADERQDRVRHAAEQPLRAASRARRVVTRGGSSGAISSWRTKAACDPWLSAPLSRMRALYQFIATLVSSEIDEIDRHGDGDDLDRLAGLVERRAGEDRDQIRIADGDRERGVLGQVEILVGQRRDDDAQRLRQDHEAQHLAARGSPSASAASRLPARHREDAGTDDLSDEGGSIGRERDQQRQEFRNQPHAADEVEALQPWMIDRRSESRRRQKRSAASRRSARAPTQTSGTAARCAPADVSPRCAARWQRGSQRRRRSPHGSRFLRRTGAGRMIPRLLRKTSPKSETLWRGPGSVPRTARYQNRIWNRSGRLRINST